jgi:hypothetical protein
MRLVRGSLAVLATSLAACGGSDEAKQQPPPIVGQVQDAMRQVRSFHISGFEESSDGMTVARGDWTAPGRTRLHLVLNSAEADFILTGEHAYIRAAAKFWRSQSRVSPRVAGILANRWLIAPQSREFSALARQLQPENMAHCITVNLGTVHEIDRVAPHGEPLRVLKLAGDQPGSAPGLVFVQAQGQPLIRRIQQTGPARPGGVHDPRCDVDGENDTTRSVMTLSRFNAPVRISAPPHPLSLDDIRSKAQSTGVV